MEEEFEVGTTIKQIDSAYVLNDDDNKEKKLNMFDDNQDYKFHLNVLPQPYFWNGKKVGILILANNPSYAENDDEYDTSLFFSKYKLDDYINMLKKVNFFEPFNTNNLYFYNTWKWWRNKVIGNLTIDSTREVNVGIINLCGYHSRYFKKEHFDSFPSINDSILRKLIKNADVVVFVWKSTKEIIEQKYKEELKGIPRLFLTKGKTFGNTNTLEQIIINEKIRTIYNESLEKSAINKLKEFFLIKKETSME